MPIWWSPQRINHGDHCAPTWRWGNCMEFSDWQIFALQENYLIIDWFFLFSLFKSSQLLKKNRFFQCSAQVHTNKWARDLGKRYWLKKSYWLLKKSLTLENVIEQNRTIKQLTGVGNDFLTLIFLFEAIWSFFKVFSFLWICHQSLN